MRSKYFQWAAKWLPIPLFVAGIVLGIVIPGDPPNETSYYGTIAQILPTLVVALAVEASAEQTWAKLPGSFRPQVFGILVFGEAAAILGAARIRPFTFPEYKVFYEFVTGFATSGAAAGFIAVVLIVALKAAPD